MEILLAAIACQLGARMPNDRVTPALYTGECFRLTLSGLLRVGVVMVLVVAGVVLAT